jgi:hypothetical protein
MPYSVTLENYRLQKERNFFLKIYSLVGCMWLTSIILDTQEAEITRRIMV